MRFLLSLMFVLVAFGVGLVAFVVGPDRVKEVTRSLIPTDFLADRGEDGTAAAKPVDTLSEPIAGIPENQRAIRKIEGIPIGAWQYDCPENKDGQPGLCVIAHQIIDRKSGAVIFSWLIGADRDGKFQGDLQTPTGILVNRGVLLDVGTPKPIAVPFTACVAGYCEAVANLAPDFVQTLMKTEKATATIYTVDGKALTFPIDANGLSDGLIALQHPDRR